jgi:RNA polymerase sigma-70 factor, ECF subfamily
VESVGPPAAHRTAEVDVDEEHRTLVDRARAGDTSAWEALYRRAFPKLLAYARARLDEEGARDAVAETMSRAVAEIHRFRWADKAIDAWLFGILRHVVTDAHRAQGRSRHVPESAPGAAPGPLDQVVLSEDHEAVRFAFARLSPSDREVLELRVVAGLPVEEVALVLDRKAGAVRMAQSRALSRMREHLADVGYPPRDEDGGGS